MTAKKVLLINSSDIGPGEVDEQVEFVLLREVVADEAGEGGRVLLHVRSVQGLSLLEASNKFFFINFQTSQSGSQLILLIYQKHSRIYSLREVDFRIFNTSSLIRRIKDNVWTKVDI